jgi:hypothetical protein
VTYVGGGSGLASGGAVPEPNIAALVLISGMFGLTSRGARRA